MTGIRPYLCPMDRIRIGTSGYAYESWRGILYPPGLAKSRWLTRYTQIFTTVELNATFYRLPTETAVDRWREGAPEGFVFACKGSRYLTHMKKLTDPGPGIARYFERVGRLGEKLGPILWQLPPQMAHRDLGRLEAFLAGLPEEHTHVFEFRSVDWYTNETADLLDAFGAAFCEHDLVDKKPPRVTGDLRYLRFHGATAKYRGRYGKRALAPFAKSLLDGSHPAFVFFNNDPEGNAVLDALDLGELVGTLAPGEGQRQKRLSAPRAGPDAPRGGR